MSLKRDAYTYEKELRLFVIPKDGGRRNKGKKAQSKDIKIDWNKVIIRVRVDKKCTDAELVSIQRACFSVGINPVIKNYTFIGRTAPPKSLTNIEFERFDIDDMPNLIYKHNTKQYYQWLYNRNTSSFVFLFGCFYFGTMHLIRFDI